MNVNWIFLDRREAGQELAAALAQYRARADVIVLGLPRGGVPVAFEVAQFLKAPLDVLIVRKLGVPGHAELAMGAIASGGVRILNDEIVRSLRITEKEIDRITTVEQTELARREQTYRGQRSPLDVRGAVVIVVDDGMATGSTMRAAVRALRTLQPARVIVAVPHAPPDSVTALGAEADDVVCLETPDPYIAVGCWYRDFPQLGDAEVSELMARAFAGKSNREQAAPARSHSTR